MAQGPYPPGPPGPYGGPPPAAGPGYPPPAHGPPKPSKVQAIAVMQLCGGIYALVQAAGVIGLFFLYLPWIYSVVLGVMAIVRSARLLGDNAYGCGNQKTIAVMQIINIINCDVVNLVLGIICLLFQSDPEVEQYLQPSYPGRPPGVPPQPGQPGQPGQSPVITGEQYPTVRR